MISGTSSRLKHLEAEVSHAQNLLVLKTGTVSELATKQKTLKAQLRRSRRESRGHAIRADALESRLDELAQILQTATADRDQLREDLARSLDTVDRLGREREEIVARHDLECTRLQNEIKRIAGVAAEARAEVSERIRERDRFEHLNAELQRKMEQMHLTIFQVETRAAAAEDRAVLAEAKIGRVLSVLSEPTAADAAVTMTTGTTTPPAPMAAALVAAPAAAQGHT